MNKKLKDVIGWEQFLEFYKKTLEVALQYNYLVKADEWEYHSVLKQAGFYYKDAFYHVACRKCSEIDPHQCRGIHSYIHSAFQDVARQEYGDDFVDRILRGN